MLHHLLKHYTSFTTAPVLQLPPSPSPSRQTDCSAYTFTKRSCRDYKEMRFFTKADESYKRKTALVSCPGSGNTWLRLALEEATGVFTGSLYNDKSLR